MRNAHLSAARICMLDNSQTFLLGLCGNNDGNPDNDMQNPDGEMCDNVQDFIASWEVKPGLYTCFSNDI